MKLVLCLHAEWVGCGDHERALRVPQRDHVALSHDETGNQLVRVRINCRKIRDRKPIVRRHALGQVLVRSVRGHAHDIPSARQLGARVEAQFISTREVRCRSYCYQPMLNDRLELHC